MSTDMRQKTLHNPLGVYVVTFSTVCLLAVGQLPASEVELVVPPGSAATEGGFANGVTSADQLGVPYKIQYLYPASDFLSLPPTHHTITGVVFRLDDSWTAPISVVSAHSEIVLSTTTATSLSTTFEDNYGPDRTIVLSRPTSPNYPLGGPPRHFGEQIIFSTPFEYDPTSGESLLLEFGAREGVQTLHAVDAATTPVVARSVFVFGDIGAVTGTFLESVVVSQFLFERDGDFDGDGELSAADIDLLSAAVGGRELMFDLDGNGTVEQEDRRFWVEDLFGTFFGDADLNKEVAFTDFLSLSNNFSTIGGWDQGDFDGDRQMRFPDFLMLAENFGKSSRGLAAVPEPNSAMLGFVGYIICTSICRKRRYAMLTRTKFQRPRTPTP